MKLSNINSEKMKQNNLRVVLDTVRQKEPISRKELADLVGLTSASITNIVNRLIAEGYLIETGSGESNGGRKPIMLALNAKAKYAIGIELSVTKIVCLLTDFKSNEIALRICATLLEEGLERVVTRILALIDAVLDDAGLAKDQIMGIGLVSAGPYDHEKGIMVNPPNFTGWYNVPIKDLIQNGAGIPTWFEKESVGAAIGEYWYGKAAGVKSLFAIDAQYIGIGGGVIIDNQVYHGFSDGAGDLGHMVIDLEGPLCSCGNYGCLEAVASGSAILRNIKSAIRRGEDSLLSSWTDDVEAIDLALVKRALQQEDALCRRMVEKSARYLGIAISNIINLLSPEMVVIGCSFGDDCPSYVEVAIEYARKRTYPLYNKDVKIIPATLGNRQCARGGIGVVFQEFYKRLELE